MIVLKAAKVSVRKPYTNFFWELFIKFIMGKEKIKSTKIRLKNQSWKCALSVMELVSQKCALSVMKLVIQKCALSVMESASLVNNIR